MPEQSITQAVNEARTDLYRSPTGKPVTLIFAEDATVAVAMASRVDAHRPVSTHEQPWRALDDDG